MKRHGISLFVAWYKENGSDFLSRNEHNQSRRMMFVSYRPTPKEITQAVCYRYLRIKNRLFVGDWNSILKIVANRVSSGPGASVILRSLWINERKKKKIRLNKNDFVCTFDKHPRSFSDIENRLISIRKATINRKYKEDRQRAIDDRMKTECQFKQYKMIRNAKEEIKLLNQSIHTFHEVLKNGKKHDEINQGFAGIGS